MTKNFTLVRYDSTVSGVFGVLLSKGFKCETLEHSYYDQPENEYIPKVPEGTYLCRKGEHRLLGMEKDFETFEIENVPGHTNILFHIGNYNKDSDGCVLLGAIRMRDAVASSGDTFNRFMKFLDGVNEFNLDVVNIKGEGP